MHFALLADMGIPMIFVQWPLMACALLPVIVIEALVVRKRLSSSLSRALIGAAQANTVSTLAGVPLAWGLMLLLEVATMAPLTLAVEKWHWHTESPVFYVLNVLAIAWVNPPIRSYAGIAFAATLLLVPTFLVSVRIERWFYRRSYKSIDRGAVDHSVWLANLCSYSLLFIAACSWFGWELYQGGEQAPAMRRMLQEHPIDVKHLHEVDIPSCDAAARPELVRAVTQLEKDLADFAAIMHEVEQGRIAVWKNLNRGGWESSVEKPDSWASVDYTGRLGPVESVQKHGNGNPASLIYIFRFNSEGFITQASLPLDEFSFNENGRLIHWHEGKFNCWGKPNE